LPSPSKNETEINRGVCHDPQAVRKKTSATRQ
jgi:hypothetical protein